MTDTIAQIEIYPLRIPRETPYLGPLRDGTAVSSGGYFVRPGNRSVYSIHDQSVVVRVRTDSGAEGWGECVGFVVPEASATILEELAAPLVIGRHVHDAAVVYEDLYNAMRVRGFFGGFYGDALAALDIALWDLKGQLTGLSVAQLLGGVRQTTIPAYASGLPAATRTERAELAAEWKNRGFDAVKFAAAVADDGEVAEIQAIRAAAGDDLRVLVDLHWRYTPAEAISLIGELEKSGLYLAEAPVAPEDIEGQARVAHAVSTPIGIGEELRTVFEYLPRFEARCMDVIQPEMGRMGITSFWQVCQLARAFHCQIMPHASIGIGIFQAASLQAAAASEQVAYHEYQHSIFDANLRLLEGDMACQAGTFTVPSGPGLGVRPTDKVLDYATTKRIVK